MKKYEKKTRLFIVVRISLLFDGGLFNLFPFCEFIICYKIDFI